MSSFFAADISRTTQDQRTKIEVLVNLNSGIFNTKVSNNLKVLIMATLAKHCFVTIIVNTYGLLCTGDWTAE